MALSVYRDVLQIPKAPSIYLLGFLARFPFSATGLVLTLHTVMSLGQNYMMAGFVVTSSTLGAAISAPWRGRLMDTKGLKRTLIPPIIVNLVFWAIAPFLPFAILLPAVFVAGLFSIPVFSIVRTSLSVVTPATMRKSAFALDSVITEFVFMLGPAAGTLLVFTWGSHIAMWVIGAAVVIAGIGLMIVDPPLSSDDIVLPARIPEPLEVAETGLERSPAAVAERIAYENTQTGQMMALTQADLSGSDSESARALDEARSLARKQLLSLGGIAILIATAVGSIILVAGDLGIVALMEGLGHKDFIGPVIAIWCLGSAIGGLAYGAMSSDIHPLWVLFGLSIVTMPIALVSNLPTAFILCFISGLGIAPSIASTGEAISRRVPEIARGEAMGWHGSAMTIGSSLGSPLVGIIIDVGGAGAAFLSAGLIGLVVAVGGLVAMRVHRSRVRARAAKNLGIEAV